MKTIGPLAKTFVGGPIFKSTLKLIVELSTLSLLRPADLVDSNSLAPGIGEPQPCEASSQLKPDKESYHVC